MLDSTVVTLALPAIRERPGRLARRPAVDPERLPADARRDRRHRRAARRHPRPPAGVRDRDGDLRRRLGASPGPPASSGVLIAARVLQGIGGAALLSLSLALTAAAFPARAPPAGARDLGRGLGDRARDRAAGRRGADRGRELALDLLHQPAGRRRRGRDPARPRLGVARRDRAVAGRPRRRRRPRRRARRRSSRAGRGRRLGLGLARDARRCSPPGSRSWSASGVLEHRREAPAGRLLAVSQPAPTSAPAPPPSPSSAPTGR